MKTAAVYVLTFGFFLAVSYFLMGYVMAALIPWASQSTAAGIGGAALALIATELVQVIRKRMGG